MYQNVQMLDVDSFENCTNTDTIVCVTRYFETYTSRSKWQLYFEFVILGHFGAPID